MPRAINVTNGYTRAQVRKAIADRRAAMGGPSWQKFGREVGISGVLLNAIARGKKPPPDKVLRAFGFSVPHVVEVPDGYGVGEACKTCGQVHTTKQCPTRRKVRVRRLHELSDKEIRAAFENRQTMEVINQ